jgi:hypothetical protein
MIDGHSYSCALLDFARIKCYNVKSKQLMQPFDGKETIMHRAQREMGG